MRVSGYTTRSGKRVGSYTRRPGFKLRKPRIGRTGTSSSAIRIKRRKSHFQLPPDDMPDMAGALRNLLEHKTVVKPVKRLPRAKPIKRKTSRKRRRT